METQEMNIAMVKVLRNWDPFNEGGDFYDTEVADCMMVMSDIKDSKEFASKIKEIYEYSFEEELAYDKCLEIANELLTIQANASCSF